jgi:F-box and WD-40 domain protein 1/11
VPVPGAAARQAAAAANQDRQNQLRREQEHQETQRFLSGLTSSISRDHDIKDNESGVDMTCASDIVRADSVTEKKMSM